MNSPSQSTLDSLVVRLANSTEHREGLRRVLTDCIAYGYEPFTDDSQTFVPTYPADVKATDRWCYRVATIEERDQARAFVDRERALVANSDSLREVGRQLEEALASIPARIAFTRENGVDTTAETIPPQSPAKGYISREDLEGERDSSLSNSVAIRSLAGILGMRADASRAAIAERARLEIERLRAIETSPPTDRQFDALLATLDTCARWHEITIPLVRQTKALVVALREQLAALERKTTESNRYRLEMETHAGAGHPDQDARLRIDLQVEE